VYPEYFFENKDPRLEYGHRDFFLFLDFDGTLVPIQDNPTRCVLSPNMKSQLEIIYQSGKVSIAILSGRTINDIKKRALFQGIYYGGNHGLEISGPDLRYVHPQAREGRRVINRVSRTIETEIAEIDGVFIERKKFGFSIHYRMATLEGRNLTKQIFFRIISENMDHEAFSVLEGKKVLEVVPNILWDKGKAVQYILGKQKSNYLPIYVGDDRTDETAFTALQTQGITIRVGRSNKTNAKYYLKGQWETLRFLRHIYDLMK
jgi:trehalose-phosphatase